MSDLSNQDKIEIMDLAQRATQSKDKIIALYHAMIKAITNSEDDKVTTISGPSPIVVSKETAR